MIDGLQQSESLRAGLDPAARLERIAAILGDATRHVLWSLYENRILSKRPAASLTTRIGTGRRTSCVPTLDGFTITFGIRMVEDSLAGGHRAAIWASFREVFRHGFFGGETTALNLLAQSTCHEFAHALQITDIGSALEPAHGEGFREALEGLHRDGSADLVREFIAGSCEREGIALEPERPSARPPESHSSSTITNPAAARPLVSYAWHFQLGERVEFEHRGRTFRGTVGRINPRTVTVAVPCEPPGSGGRWRVPPRLLRRADQQLS